ncbi:MAG: cobalamin-binding protein [Betaproteobacteria bacterium]|nr:cobalamin-binding protein [Betaproteobacteria bacterium]
MQPLSFLLALVCLLAVPAHAEIVVRDDTGATIRLPAPARRIVSLAPHVTENLYAAGAGARIVGAVEYSDHPEPAKALPRVGGYSRLDLEAIVALKPDLVIAWQSGNSAAAVAKLQALGLPVYQSQPDRLEDIAANIERLGRLAGTEATARRAAEQLRQRLAALHKTYAKRGRVPVFYQVWPKPLLTVGGDQIIGDVIRLCGGDNVFAHLGTKAPAVSVEAVLAADPEAIVASGMGRDTPVALEAWRAWPKLRAVAHGNLFYVPSDLLQRPTPRMLDGAEALCRHLDAARAKRPAQ